MYPPYTSLFEDKENRMGELINTMKSVEIPQPQQVSYEPGPFSSLFSYEQEVQRMEDMNKRRAEMNQKLMRGNGIVDAFRLITQGIGGAFGSSIPKETPNQSVLAAFDDYRKMDAETRERLDRFRMLELNNMARDLQYRQGLEAEERERGFRRDLSAEERDFRSQESEKERGFKAGQTEQGYKQAENLEKIRGEQDIRQEQVRGQYDLERQKLYNEAIGQRGANNPTIDGVQITDDMASKILLELDKLYPTGNANRPKVLNDAMRNKNIQDPSLLLAVRQNWDHLTKTIPELGVRMSENPANGQPSTVDDVKKNKDVVVSTIDDIAYNRPDLTDRKKRKQIVEILMDPVGFGMTEAEAESRARMILAGKETQRALPQDQTSTIAPPGNKTNPAPETKKTGGMPQGSQAYEQKINNILNRDDPYRKTIRAVAAEAEKEFGYSFNDAMKYAHMRIRVE